MYDKYNSLTPFTVGTTKLPKHKGILVSNTVAANTLLATQILTSSGTTGNASFAMPSSFSILPVEVYSVTNLNGMTAWLLN